ncbi:hypothetical protein AAMO2058_000545900 [Amorphochlora amoebiformis]
MLRRSRLKTRAEVRMVVRKVPISAQKRKQSSPFVISVLSCVLHHYEFLVQVPDDLAAGEATHWNNHLFAFRPTANAMSRRDLLRIFPGFPRPSGIRLISRGSPRDVGKMASRLLRYRRRLFPCLEQRMMSTGSENTPSWIVPLPTAVKIVEVGPRDGLQNEKQRVPAHAKIELINKLSNTGLSVVEATSFVSPRWVPQMADAAEVLDGIERKKGVSYPVLCPNMKGLESALEHGAEEISVFSAASESFTKRNINKTIKESLDMFEPVIETARKEGLRVRGYVSCVLGCPYEGTIKPAAVAEVSNALYEMGCYEISLGDTIGVGNPGSAVAMIRAVKELIPVTALAAHFHDTYGQALVNLLAALQEEVSIIDSAVGGLGGCPYAKGATGNVATEDVLYMLAGLGVETNVDLQRVMEAGGFISKCLGKPSHSRVANSIWRRSTGVRVSFHYKEVLATALADGTVTDSEKTLIEQYRLRHNIGTEEHNLAIRALGWTKPQYVRGFK